MTARGASCSRPSGPTSAARSICRPAPATDLGRRIGALVGYRGAIAWDTSKPNGEARRVVDPTRAREWLGFTATTTLDEGLSRTYEWMLQHVPVDAVQ